MMIYQRLGSEQLSSPKIKILEVTNKNREIENSKNPNSLISVITLRILIFGLNDGSDLKHHFPYRFT